MQEYHVDPVQRESSCDHRELNLPLLFQIVPVYLALNPLMPVDLPFGLEKRGYNWIFSSRLSDEGKKLNDK